MTPKRKESETQRAILDYLHLHGIFAWRQKNEGTWDAARGIRRKGTGTPGLSDIGGVLPGRKVIVKCRGLQQPGIECYDEGGRCLQIEVKTSTGHLTATQKEFLERARSKGALAFTARSVQDVENKLREEGYIK